MVPRNDDVILKPDARNQRRTRRVLLQAIVISAEVIDRVPCWNFVDSSGSIFPKPVRLRFSAVEVLVHIAARVVVDLHFKAGDHGAPCRIAGDFVRVGT
jgi:hypothetical protein